MIGVSTGNSILSSYGTTIFEVMSRLAQEHDAINLGQGFPDGNGPDDVVEAGVDYLRNGVNQYPSMFGLPDLRQAVAEHVFACPQCDFTAAASL
ncbi:MAG: aminotransferase class I/II-fold pyridoxal phosphate-dependent enzyme, partial [Alphaproteobacteria bacterium]|nr:aminotransferase class I/II-fold pyridoxal phosphate-dependent enzyme [Alphaproteobacteria bacterium]